MSDELAPVPAAEPQGVVQAETPPAVPVNPAEPAADGQPKQPEEKPARVFTQEELDRIVAKRLDKAERAWERRNQQLMETALSRLAPQQPVSPATVTTTDDGAPDPTKFADYGEYMREVARFEARKTLEAERRAAEEQTTARSHQARAAELQANFQKQLEQASAKYEDFEDVALNPMVPISPVMAEAIAESEMGAELAYFLGKNIAEAQRIAALPPVRAAKELGKLEAKLTAPRPPEVSKAPPPVNPVGTKASAGADPDKMTTEEWLAWRNSQLKKSA